MVNVKNAKKLSALMLIVAFAGGCATEGGGLTERETGALLGSGLGAGLGAIVGNQSGHAGAGTAIGAGAGALAGALLGESQRRQKANTERMIKEQMMQQQYQQQYAPQPYQQAPQQQMVSTTAQPSQEIHTKYNPRTGQTYPERFQFDPNTGEQLQYLR